MFTGLVQAVGRVVGVDAHAGGARLNIDASAWDHRPAPGDSVSVSGCCLTVAAESAGVLAFDAVPETLRLTTLATLARESTVNLEHAARVDSLMGGHVVQGHVDGVAEVTRVEKSPEYRVRFRPPGPLMEFMIPKGSVCIDGVSLTIAAVHPAEGWFEVALIPVTLEKTTLGALDPGARANIETDILARTVVHWMKNFRAP